MDNFISIKENIQTEIVVKKSKFICNLIKVETQEEAENIIKQIKKKYYDARHNCVAYRVIDDEKIVEKASDDGEPSGTAGGPMLNILQKNNLCNVVAIVTRYFGGILLGTGGLVRAYSDATIDAIEISEKVEICMGQELEAEIEYNNLESFKYYCKINDIYINDFGYSDRVICKIQLEDVSMQRLVEDFETKKVNLINLKFLSKKLINKSIIK
ncbi:MAG: YigZ family protein [Clostridia bacterium]|nr:YigZ family protein [Clostridia bacterium]